MGHAFDRARADKDRAPGTGRRPATPREDHGAADVDERHPLSTAGRSNPLGWTGILARADGATRARLVVGLQRTHGNAAVQRLVAAWRGSPRPEVVPALALGGTAQRDEQATPAKADAAITISFGKNAKESDVSEYARQVLTDVLRAAGLTSATISSTARDAANQARVMYDNLEGKGKGKGVAAQKALYGAGGDQVIDAYVAAKKEKKTAAEIKAAMRAKIEAVGPKMVSRHASDPKVLNVFDVAPSSIADQKALVKAAKAEEGKRISKFIPYPKDPGHHFEIPPK